MTRAVLPDAALSALRTIGDPDLHALAAELPGALVEVRTIGLRGFAASGRWREMVAAVADEPPLDLDVDKLDEAQHLFSVFGTEIAGALLLAALPQSYACALGVGVLGANERLETDLVRRIRGTAQFLMAVMERAGSGGQAALWRPSTVPAVDRAGPAPWEVCAALRVYHEAIRADLDARRAAGNEQVAALLGEQNTPPLNQEDLLGMMLSFSITVFEVLERFGITWTADQQEAYLHAWDVIGAYLGIGTPGVIERLGGAHLDAHIDATWHGLRPPTVAATRELLDQLRARQWIDPAPTAPFEVDTWSSLRAGRILTKALLDELAAAMPPSMALLPVAVVRMLAPEVVRRRLSLGTNGLVLRAVGALPSRRQVVDRFTAVRMPNRLGGRVLRTLANEVTSRAAMRFVHDGEFVIPGLDLDRG